jgi:HlyD family secretion protein
MAQLQLQQCQRSLIAAKKTRELVEAMSPIASLEKQIEIVKLQQEQSSVLAPFDGVVISLNAEKGERTAQFPLMDIADLSSMQCIAEVHESDAGRIAIDDRVELSSSALSKKLSGRVVRIDRIVGAAQMRSPNPMARSDFRSIPVWISIDKDDTEAAAERLQLQVDVSFTTTR